MAESINNYPLSTEQNDFIPLDVAKPSRLHMSTANTTGLAIEFASNDNNIVSITSDTLSFISVNPAVEDFADIVSGGFTEGVYAITEGYTHVLALPKNVTLFSSTTDAAKRVILQEVIRWAALGGQSVSYEVS